MEEVGENVVRRQAVADGTGGICRYCGAGLNPFYYFCVHCATPYKEVESLVGTVRPAPMGDESRIQMMVPQVWTMFGVYGLVIIGAAIVALGVAGVAGSGSATFLITGSLAVTATTLVYATIYWRSLGVQLRWFGFNQWPAWAGLAALVPLLGLNVVYHGVLRSMEGVSDPMPKLLEGLGLPGMVLLICVFPAIMEELAFRGLLQHWLEVAVSPWKAIVIGAGMFAALHFSLLSLPYLFLVGVLLGWMKQRTRSLYPSMLAHFLHNLTVVMLAYYMGGAGGP